MTTWLLMAMTDYWLAHDLISYGDVCYHIIPMVNPDGVVISQTGKLTEEQQKIYRYDHIYGYIDTDSDHSYTQRWKANGNGVDINRNFPSGWENFDDRTFPSSQGYRGTAPFSSAEAAALRDYTLKYSFDATVSYHASGSLLYYEYGNNEPAIAGSHSLAKVINAISGYTIEEKSGLSDAYGGGYKDWAIEELGIPSVTVEIGCKEAPLAEREIYSIFVRNYRILPQIARWLRK